MGVVSGLIKKRAELAGQIEVARQQIEVWQNTLRHLNSTIRLFVPETNLRTIPAKRPSKHNIGKAEYLAKRKLAEFSGQEEVLCHDTLAYGVCRAGIVDPSRLIFGDKIAREAMNATGEIHTIASCHGHS